MSDVSKLKINNVTYNIKDSLALRDAPSNGNEYVRKNGTWTIATGGGDGTYLGDSIEFENNSAIITTAEETANEFVKKSEITWTKAGSVTGTNTVTVPATAKEVMAIVRTASSNSVIYTNYCLKAELSSIWVIGGYSIGSSDYGIVNLNVSNSSRTFQIRNARYEAQDYKSSSVLTIYYR